MSNKKIRFYMCEFCGSSFEATIVEAKNGTILEETYKECPRCGCKKVKGPWDNCTEFRTLYLTRRYHSGQYEIDDVYNRDNVGGREGLLPYHQMEKIWNLRELGVAEAILTQRRDVEERNERKRQREMKKEMLEEARKKDIEELRKTPLYRVFGYRD